MEQRMQAHRGCYRASFGLLKEEFGAVMTAGIILIMVGLTQGMLGIIVDHQFSDVWYETLINLSIQMAWFLVVTGPLILGVMRWFYFLPVRVVPLFEVFYYWQNSTLYRRAINFNFQLTWRVALTGVLCCLPGALLQWLTDYFADTLLYSGLVYSLAAVLSELLLFVGIGVAIYRSFGWFLAQFLLFEEQLPEATLCIRYSYGSMKEYRLDILVLVLSLFPVYLTGIFVIPLFFIIPYLILLCAHRSRELLEQLAIHS